MADYSRLLNDETVASEIGLKQKTIVPTNTGSLDAAGEKPTVDYGALLDDQAVRSSINFQLAGERSPGDHARARDQSNRTGLPADFHLGRLQEYDAIIQRERRDQILKRNRAMEEVFSNDANAAGIWQNDIEAMNKVMESPLWKVGSSLLKIDGEYKLYSQRPSAADFPITGTRGFREANEQLREAQRQWDADEYRRNQEVDKNDLTKGNLTGIERTTWEGFYEPFKSGWKVGTAYTSKFLSEYNPLTDAYNKQKSTLYEREGMYFDSKIEEAIRYSRMLKEAELPVPAHIREGMQKIGEAKTFGEAFQAIYDNPGALIELIQNSMGMSGAVITTSAVSSFGGATTMIPSTFVAGFALEYMASIHDAIENSGYDTKDGWDLYQAYSNPDLMAIAKSYALRRGITIASFDAMSAGLTSAFTRSALKQSGRATIGATTASVTAQAVSGAGGEGTAQYITGYNNPSDVLIEAIAEMPTAIPEGLSAYRDIKMLGAQEHEARRKRADNATQNAEKLSEINTTLSSTDAMQTGVSGREALEKALESQTGDDVITIDAETYNQIIKGAGGLDAVQSYQPAAVKEQLGGALDRKGDLVIPTNQFIASFANTPVFESLLDHVRTTPDAFTLSEAREFYQNGDQNLQEQTQKIANETSVKELFENGRKSVRDIVTEDIKAATQNTPKVTPDSAEWYADLIASYYSTRASQMLTTPDQLFTNDRLGISSSPIRDARVFGQEPATFTPPSADLINLDANQSVGDFANPMVAQPSGGFSRALNIPTALLQSALSQSVNQGAPNASTLELLRNNWEAEKAKLATNPPKIQIGADGTPTILEGQEALQVAQEKNDPNVPVEVSYVDGGDTAPGAFAPENLLGADQQINEANAAREREYAQSATLRRGTETLKRFGLTPGKIYRTREVAAALEARQREKYGKIEADDRSKEAQNKIAKWMAEEIKFELQNPEASGVGWYTEKFQRAIDVLADSYPELAQDQSARDILTALIAITSDGQKVVPNFQHAMNIYGNFRDGGATPGQFTQDRSTQRAASVANNLQTLQRLYDMMGADGMRDYLLSEKSISELKQIAREHGGDFKSDYQAKTMMPMAAIELGPKLGAFYANLMGASGYLTMDRWWSRTFNRYRGTLLQKPTDQGLSRFKELMGHPEWSDDEALSATVEPRNNYANRNFKNGSEIEKAANTIYKAAFENIEDTPFNATDRTFMLETVAKAQKNLKRAGVEMSIADIQATLWYYEKRLYGELGARQTADISYEDAAAIVVSRVEREGSTVPDTGVESGVDGRVSEYTSEPGTDYFQSERNPEDLDSRRGSFSPERNVITLLNNANYSTFVHETGHFFFENDLRLANRLLGKPDLSKGEQQIIDDVSTLLNWHGFKGPVHEQLNQWYSLTHEQMTPHHEMTAEAFERYVLEGKAPSVELQSAFRRLAAFMVRVYRDLKGFLTQNPSAGKLNPEVRAVFDRMLASGEQIRFAENSQSMMPLFANQEQMGVSPEVWRQYQTENLDASIEAAEQLRTKSIKNIRWISNAVNKEFRRMQRSERATRSNMRDEVRAEVLENPVYQAWQFLTNRIKDGDRIEPYENPANPKPGRVDTAVDPFLVAVAKLGGLDRDEIQKSWGIDPKDKSPLPFFATPVWRAKNGLSIESMAEKLASRGYIPQDADGKYDVNEFEDLFDRNYRGEVTYSSGADWKMIKFPPRPGDQVKNPQALNAGRLDLAEVVGVAGAELSEQLKSMGMTAKNGLHPDLVAELFGFDSGDALIKALVSADSPHEVIEGLTQRRMIERYSDLADPEAMRQAAERLVHNDARMRYVAMEINALGQSLGERKVLAAAAKTVAQNTIDGLKVKNVRPVQYSYAATRAANNAERALKIGDTRVAFTEKRTQILNLALSKSGYAAKDEIDKGLKYFTRFNLKGPRSNIDVEYLEQIDDVLSRFNLSKSTVSATTKRNSMIDYIDSSLATGIIPDIPIELFLGREEAQRYRAEVKQAQFKAEEATRDFDESDEIQILKGYLRDARVVNYNELTVAEFRDLVDTVTQIEHLGKLKHTLLTSKEKEAFGEVVQNLATSIHQNAVKGKKIRSESPATRGEALGAEWERFMDSHIRASTHAYILDGGRMGGEMWNRIIRTANERASREATMKVDATKKLQALLKPIFKGQALGKRKFIAAFDASFTREQMLMIALNRGNESNIQRLIDGHGFSLAQIDQALSAEFTAREFETIQAIGDFVGSYRDEVGATSKRLNGTEPKWITPMPFSITGRDGEKVNLDGWYFPVSFDPYGSVRAQEQQDESILQLSLKAARSQAVTRQSFLKSRVQRVIERPLLLSSSVLFDGIHDVIHYIVWQDWVTDFNRIMNAQAVKGAIKNNYGVEVNRAFRRWSEDLAAGDRMPTDRIEAAARWVRGGISAAGLGFNLLNAVLQFTGFFSSLVRVKPRFMATGLGFYLKNPWKATRDVKEMSEFMSNRAITRYRELNELKNVVRGKSEKLQNARAALYILMLQMQQVVDVITWRGAYYEALTKNEPIDKASAIADQVIKDTQGGGEKLDLSPVERGGELMKAFTVFYNYMNTQLQLAYGNQKTKKGFTRIANYLLLFVFPLIAGDAIKSLLQPSADDDEDFSPIGYTRKMAAEGMSYALGFFVFGREFSGLARGMIGDGPIYDYSGPAGTRQIADIYRAGQQIKQGEVDKGLVKAMISVFGTMLGLPSAQINRTLDGYDALESGDTGNPLALGFGYAD